MSHINGWSRAQSVLVMQVFFLVCNIPELPRILDDWLTG
jgi:hypothetical protein